MTQLLVSVMMILVCWNITAFVGRHKAVEWVSRHNFTIYIFSWPVQAVTMAVCDRLETAWYLQTLLMFLAGAAGPAAIILVYGKLPSLQCRFWDLVLGLKHEKTNVERDLRNDE